MTQTDAQAELQAEVVRLAGQGYVVASQTTTSAQLVKRKRFNLLLFVVLLAIPYLLIYAMQKDQTVFLDIDPSGKLQRSGSSFRMSRRKFLIVFGGGSAS